MSTVEALDGPIIPRSITLNRFWEGVLNGGFVPTTSADIETFLKESVLTGTPLIPLTEDEEKRLHQELADHYLRYLNDDTYKGLADNPVVHLEEWTHREHPQLSEALDYSPGLPLSEYFLVGAGAETAVGLGYPIISSIEKLTLYSDPQLIDRSRVYIINQYTQSTFTNPFISQGSRPLFYTDDWHSSYGIEKEEFDKDVQEVQRRTGRRDLRICDIGGNIGLACHEIRETYPSFEVTNITVDEEPGMWPGVNHVVVPAERMPREFAERFDVMVSNMAWRYFLYPDLAFMNTIAALSIGGLADISFSTDRSHLERGEIRRRMRNLLSYLIDLQDKGVVKTNIDISDWNDDGYLGNIRIDKLTSLPVD